MWERLRHFRFPVTCDRWVGILRIGLGIQVTLYAWALRADWADLFGTKTRGAVNRALAEAVFSAQSILTPRLGWIIDGGKKLGLAENFTLSLIWVLLLSAGLLLLIGLCSRAAAVLAWFLYLSSAKSGVPFAYGVDNFTVIGLFYLMIAPLPDRWSLDCLLRTKAGACSTRLGFHRRILQLHLCLIYFFGGIAKSLGAEWWNGTSVWRALTRPPFDLIDPDLLVRFAPLFPLIGILVCLLETGYPLFIWRKSTRPFWLAGIVGMHLSIGLTMGLYLFAWVMIVLNLAAFAPEYCHHLEKVIRAWRKTKDSSFTVAGHEADPE